jgi:hydrogenase expression/formation protein HypE
MTAPAFVTLGHGSGGRLTHELVEAVFLRHLGNSYLEPLGDAAILPALSGSLAMTTDGFVITPLFFPGGDIGHLAVNGTVNDLAVSGAVPLFLSAAFVIEEGMPIGDLERIAASMAQAAANASVQVVTGDTKVVERGHGDGVFIVTTGVGRTRSDAPLGPKSVRSGDKVVLSGPVGDHGAVIAAHRSGLEVGTALVSDCGSVARLVDAVYGAGVRPKFMRDPTRGGLATILAELAKDADVTVEIFERDLPVRNAVAGICDILGLDPLYLPCEGRVALIVPAGQAEQAVCALKGLPEGKDAAAVGVISRRGASPVVLKTKYGGGRAYDTLASEQLPRIC